MDDLRVDGDNELGRLILGRDIDDHHPLVDSDLRRGQPDPGGGVHGFRHVPDQFQGLIGNYGDRQRFFLKIRVGIGEYLSYHSLPVRIN